ncbi:MAG: arsenate reductase [Flavobacteriales bacterium]|nr:arsenate reductase [Flavobacteriales bacterium]
MYHAPRSRDCQKALKRLEQAGIEPQVVDYLSNVPTERELEMLVMKLGIKPEALLRKNEALYRSKYKGLRLNDHEWIKVMQENPVLIDRPIIVRDHKAVIGRPPENIDELLG